MKGFIATLLKVFETEVSLESAKRELTEARRDLPKVFGRSWSDRAHF